MDLTRPIAQRLLAGVDSPRVMQLSETLLQYTGQASVLRDMLDETGTENLYDAVDHWELANVSVDRRKAGVSRTGQHVSTLYTFRNINGTSQLYHLGEDASVKLFSTFGGAAFQEQFSPLEKPERKARKKKVLDDTMRDLESILNPRRSLAERSLQDALDRIGPLAQQFLQDREEIYAVLFHNMSLEGLALEFGEAVLNERGGKGSYFRKNFKDLPEDVQDSWVYTTNKHVDVTTEAYRKHMMNVTLFYLLRTPVKTASILGSFIQDVKFLQVLAEKNPEHPLIKQHGVPRLTEVYRILEKPEVTLSEAARALQSYPVHKIRIALGEEYDLILQAEIAKFSADIRSLFLDSSEKLLEDCYTTVPERIGRESFFSIALNSSDFKEVGRYFRLSMMGRDDPLHNVRAALSVEQYQELMNNVFVAAAKWNAFKGRVGARIDAIDLAQPDEGTLATSKDSAVLKGKGYAPLQYFEIEFGISWEEFTHRLKTLRSTGLNKLIAYFATRHLAKLEEVAKHGVYQVIPSLRLDLEQAVVGTKRFIPLATVRDDLTRAYTLFTHPLCSYGVPYVLPALHIPYVLKSSQGHQTTGTITQALTLLGTLDEIAARYNTEHADLAQGDKSPLQVFYERIAAAKSSKYFHCFKEEGAVKLRSVREAETIPSTRVEELMAGYFVPQEVHPWLEDLTARYQPMTAGLKNMIKKLVHFDNKEKAAHSGLDYSTNKALWIEFISARAPSLDKIRVTPQFVETIQGLYAQVFQN